MLDLSKFPTIKGRIIPKALLKDYLVYKIGGPAEVLVEAAEASDIQKTLEFCSREKLSLHVLGNGSNLLVRDGGLKGVTLYIGSRLEGKWETLEDDSDYVRIRVPAHWSKAKLLDLALEKHWAGLEFSAGIPGTLGGAVYMNAGTKWGSYASVVEKVRFYSVEKGFFEKTNEEMKFKYRGHGEGLMEVGTVIVSVDLKLLKNKTPTEIRKLVDEILSYRGSKQPLELPNCGSVFKNPEHSEMGAGRLIEACQLKGTRIGNAQISLKHANFILNLGDAKAQDVEALIELIQKTVLREKGVALEPEVLVIGEKAS